MLHSQCFLPAIYLKYCRFLVNVNNVCMNFDKYGTILTAENSNINESKM